ncbi:hypothetical protein IKF23_03610 [Candidatus Saccharibacteria bacterium]|nr:hypothetical protein [Candidatus Saccharibacteria bacterium]
MLRNKKTLHEPEKTEVLENVKNTDTIKVAKPLSMEKEEPHKGGRNLVLLAIISITITLSLTTVSLAIYHYSGDIYLDRSRPGYLPDDVEMEKEEETEEGEYNFAKNGPLTKEVLEEYLKKLQIEVDALNAYQNPFDEAALSDAQFGLDTETPTESSTEQPPVNN